MLSFTFVVAVLAVGASGQTQDADSVSLLQVHARQQKQGPVKISCYSKDGVYFWGTPAYSASPGWTPCNSKYDADFYAFAEEEPGTEKITCYSKNGGYFYSGAAYDSSWPTCASKGIVGSDFYAFPNRYPKSVEITCATDDDTYFYSGPGYTSSWSACSADYDAIFYAFQNPSDYEVVEARQNFMRFQSGADCEANGASTLGTSEECAAAAKEDPKLSNGLFYGEVAWSNVRGCFKCTGGCSIQFQNKYFWNPAGTGECDGVSECVCKGQIPLDGLDEEEAAEEVEDEESSVTECKQWCYSKKHKNKAWLGEKCNWYACASCSEC